MPYRVNGKNLAVGRLMVRGKAADKRLKYIHISPKGTTVSTPLLVARVSLPPGEQGIGAEVLSQEQIDKIMPLTSPESEDIVTLPEGEPAVTGPAYIVPQIDRCLLGPEYTTETFTCNAELLRKILVVACEVSKDGDKAIRLRICKDVNSLRIDAYRYPGDQEFCAVLKGIEYDGDYIPGEMPSGEPQPEKKPQQQAMALRVTTGRKFRGVGE